MSDTVSINLVPTAVPATVLGLSDSGSLVKSSLSSVFAENPECKAMSASMAKDVWYVVARSQFVQGGSGLAYIYRDWGTGGSVYCMLGFCLPHANQAYSDSWKPQVVFAIGQTSALKVRVVKSVDKSWRLDVSQGNSSSVHGIVRLPFYSRISPGDLSEASIDSTDQVWEYSIADLIK